MTKQRSKIQGSRGRGRTIRNQKSRNTRKTLAVRQATSKRGNSRQLAIRMPDPNYQENIRSQIRGAGKYARRLLSQIVAPGSQAAKPSPSLSPFTGASRHLRRVLTLQASGPNQPFALWLRPTLSEFLGWGVAVSTVARQLLDTGMVSVPTYTSGVTNPMGAVYATNRDKAPYVVITSGFVGVPANCFGYAADCPTNGTRLSIVLVAHTSAQLCVYSVDNAGAVTQYNKMLSKGQNGSYTGATTVGVNSKVYMGCEVISGEVSWTMTTNHTCTLDLPLDVNSMNIVNDEWIERGQVAQHRISAMSVLASYRGNAIESAGVISGALVRGLPPRRGVEPLYNILSRLPDKSYCGPLNQGAYAYWVPQEISELDFSEDPPLTTLMLAGDFVDGGGALEVTVDVVVDFYSPLQIFEKQAFPAFDDEAMAALHYLNTLNPVMCNPKHWGNIKKILADGAGKAVHVAKWGYNNRELISAVATALSGLMA